MNQETQTQVRSILKRWHAAAEAGSPPFGEPHDGLAEDPKLTETIIALDKFYTGKITQREALDVIAKLFGV